MTFVFVLFACNKKNSEPQEQTPQPSIEITKSTFYLEAGQTEDISSYIIIENQGPANLVITNSNEEVAALGDDFVLKALKAGTTTIKIKLGEEVGTIKVEVSENIPPQSIELTQNEFTLDKGTELNISEYIVLKNIKPADLIISSNNERVAILGTDLILKGIGEGATTIDIKYGELSVSISVKVIVAPIADVTIAVGDSFPLKPFYTNIDFSQASISITSSLPEVATIEADQTVVGKAAGKTIITIRGAAIEKQFCLCVENTFHMWIENIFKIENRGTIITGQVKSGSIRKNEQLAIISNTTALQECNSIAVELEMFNKQIDVLNPGDNGAILLNNTEKESLRTGFLVTDVNTKRFCKTQNMTGQLYVLTREEGGSSSPINANGTESFEWRMDDNSSSNGTIVSNGVNTMLDPGETYKNIKVEAQSDSYFIITLGMKIYMRSNGRVVGIFTATKFE